MSLKEKAKTLPEWHVEVRKKGETDCGCCSSIGTKDACCDCAVILSWHPKFIEVSVAQQEIDKLKTFRDNAYKKWCESQDKFESKIQSDQNVIEELVRERGLQKQKLQQIAVEIENLRRHNQYNYKTDKWQVPQRQLFALEKEFEGLLK